MGDINMWAWDWNLNNLEVVKLIKDYTMYQAQSEVKLYLDTNTNWIYGDLIDHL